MCEIFETLRVNYNFFLLIDNDNVILQLCLFENDNSSENSYIFKYICLRTDCDCRR